MFDTKSQPHPLVLPRTRNQPLYDEYAAYYSGFQGDNWAVGPVIDHIEELWHRHSLTDIRSVLDVGCGPGRHAYEFNRRGWKTACVDANDPMLTIASRLVGGKDIYHDRMQRLNDVPGGVGLVTLLNNTVGYNTSTTELRQTLESAASRLVQGGMIYFDIVYTTDVDESLYTGKESYTSTSGRGKAVRVGEVKRVNYRTAVGEYIIMVEEDGYKKYERDTHEFGIFPLKTVKKTMRKVGFKPRVYNLLSDETFDGTSFPAVVGIYRPELALV